MKAVCIDAFAPELTEGAVYTVDSIGWCCEIFLGFAELHIVTEEQGYNTCGGCGRYCDSLYDRWDHTAFRPLHGAEQTSLDHIEEEMHEHELLEL